MDLFGKDGIMTQIFSANDVVVNSGVIISGILVYVLGSNIPDLIIGGIVSAIVIRGGVQILRIAKMTRERK